MNVDSRLGVSRQGLKKYFEERYQVDPDQTSTKNAIAKAINVGVDLEKLVQPKGTSRRLACLHGLTVNQADDHS